MSEAEVRALQRNVEDLQAQYDVELERKNGSGEAGHSLFRAMVVEMGPMLDRGFVYAGGDPLLANPFTKVFAEDESALAEGYCKSSNYKRSHKQLENDSLSRIEKDLVEAKASLRVLSKALDASTLLTPNLSLPRQVSDGAPVAVANTDTSARRPRIPRT